MAELYTISDFESNVTCACYAGDIIVAGLEDGSIILCNDKIRKPLDKCYCPGLAINKIASAKKDGKWLIAVCSSDNTVRMYVLN